MVAREKGCRLLRQRGLQCQSRSRPPPAQGSATSERVRPRGWLGRMAQDEEMKRTFISDPHLNPLGAPPGRDPGENAQRPMRVVSRIVWRIVDVIIGGLFIYAGAIKVL